MNTLSRSLCAVTLLCGCVSLGGCAATERDRPDQPTPRTTEKSSPSVAASGGVRDYALGQRAEFVADMKRALALSQAELDRLSTSLDKIETNRRHDAEAARDDARQKWNRVKQQLDTAENATEDNWEEVKRGVHQTYGEFEDSVTTTRQWLADQIAPDETPTKTASE
jgi:hypothetical protein